MGKSHNQPRGGGDRPLSTVELKIIIAEMLVALSNHDEYSLNS